MENCLKTVESEVNGELVKLFGNKIDRIILYGSYARGDFNIESDIDIMVLLNCSKDEILSSRELISKIASRVGLKNDVVVSLLVRNSEDYKDGVVSAVLSEHRKRRSADIWIIKQIANAQYFYKKSEEYIMGQIEDR